MNIVYISMQFPAPSETFASLDVNELLKLDNNIDIYCLRNEHKEFESLCSERHNNYNLNIEHMSFLNFLRSLKFMIVNPLKLFKLIKWIFTTNSKLKDIFKSLLLLPSILYIFSDLIKKKPDIIHLFWGHYPSMLLYLIKNYRSEIPFTMFLGAHDLEAKYQGSIYMSNYAEIIFTHSYDNVSVLTSMGIRKKKIKVIHRGTIVNNEIINSVKKKVIRKKDFVFLCASRLIKEKGVDEVINIFNNFLKKNRKSKLYIAGEGSYTEALRKMVEIYSIEKNVIFLGHISQNELFKYMIESDFFILMSRYKSERLPNVLKEAMLRKCVCITTYTTGIEELISNKFNGFIFNTEHEVEEFLLKKKLDIKLLNNISENAINTILEEFNVTKSMIEYSKNWEKILRKENEE